MQPLMLMLKGFRGIRDGLGLDQITLDLERLAEGAELIAIAGANGSGKTTLMDNLSPFMVLPSRAGTAGQGGFSYYDHVFLPENIKDLSWSHEGRRYRSQIVIRLDGRRRTEAFLHVLEAGSWQPMRLDDGTLSDGRVETYTRCVEFICGSAETFFTSVFAAQGTRQLSSYRNAEIKTLLADLLGQEQIRALGQQAAETARLLKAGLSAIRQEQVGIDDEFLRLEANQKRLDETCCVALAESARQAAQTALEAAQSRQARLVFEHEQSRATEARRAQLTAERQGVLDADVQARQALRQREQVERARLVALDQRIAHRRQQAQARRQSLVQSRQGCVDMLGEAGAVRRAALRLPLAQRLQRLREVRTLAERERVQRLTQCRAAVHLIEQKLAGIERDAGKAVLRAKELARRFGLTGAVPCAGTGLQRRCSLLHDAHEAQALIPNAQSQLATLAREKVAAQGDLAAVRQQHDALAAAPRALKLAERREAVARERSSRLAVLAAKAPACAQARATLAEIDIELAALDAQAVMATTCEERTEREQVAAARKAIAEQSKRLARQTAAALARLDGALATLPAAHDERRLTAAAVSIADARTALAAADRTLMVAVRDAEAREELCRQSAALTQRRAQCAARGSHVETQLGHWNLFVRCMSNDGLIALAIDDACPTLSALANDLLLSCYGPRFTVSIRTLLQTASGEQREGFDIVVHDGDTGLSKSVGLMSGGERTFVEACLTRAIALYLARHTGRRYSTLFTDEADGALDPQRKRMFMAMKREVLRLGGYERDFFVSQTPELAAMADAVIDLDAMRVGSGVERCIPGVG